MIVLVGSTPTLDVFVTENLYNVNYDDRELYYFDGYAVKIDATIQDQQAVGMCINLECWSMQPNFEEDTF